MVDVARQAVVAVLTRAPSAGGKSRLFAALGRPPAPALLAALFLDTLDAVAAAPGAMPIVCFTPDQAEAEMRALAPAGVPLLPQGEGDLGARMRRAFDALFAAGARAVVLVGSDLPLIEPVAIAGAYAHLRADPDAVVVGPAADGGYYLIAATRTPGVLFDGIAWGTPAVLAETRSRAQANGLRIHLVAPAADVDTPEDLRRLIGAGLGRAPRTRDWVTRSL